MQEHPKHSPFFSIICLTLAVLNLFCFIAIAQPSEVIKHRELIIKYCHKQDFASAREDNPFIYHQIFLY
jgi:hypothetical protein